LVKRIKIINYKKKKHILYQRLFYKKFKVFFNIDKFYNINNIKIKKINFKDYTNRQLHYLKTHVNNQIFLILKKKIEKFKCRKLFITATHGDFVHYNTITSYNNFYTIDFEYFENNKIFNYDLYNWYFTPLLTNIKRYKLNFFSNYIISIYFYFLKKINFGYKSKINKSFYDKEYLFFFLLDKYLFYLIEKNKNDYYNNNKLEKLVLKKLLNYQ